MRETPAPLELVDCSLLILSLARSAQNLREFRDHLAIVPAQSIAHHFYDSLLRPSFDHPSYRNDFARWASRHLQDEQLGEVLNVCDPLDFRDAEELRQHLLDAVEDRLAERSDVPQAPRGKEFHFLSSQIVLIETGRRADTPRRLGALVPMLSTGSIFYHFIEARRRNPSRRDDFSLWLEEWTPRPAAELAGLKAIDPYMWSLGDLRDRIAACFEDTGAARESAAPGASAGAKRASRPVEPAEVLP